jgi:hypothetical protein
MDDVRFSALRTGLKGAFYLLVDRLVDRLVNRQKIVVHALVIAKVAVFFGLLSHKTRGQMSSDPLLFSR